MNSNQPCQHAAEESRVIAATMFLFVQILILLPFFTPMPHVFQRAQPLINFLFTVLGLWFVNMPVAQLRIITNHVFLWSWISLRIIFIAFFVFITLIAGSLIGFLTSESLKVEILINLIFLMSMFPISWIFIFVSRYHYNRKAPSVLGHNGRLIYLIPFQTWLQNRYGVVPIYTLVTTGYLIMLTVRLLFHLNYFLRNVFSVPMKLF